MTQELDELAVMLGDLVEHVRDIGRGEDEATDGRLLRLGARVLEFRERLRPLECQGTPRRQHKLYRFTGRHWAYCGTIAAPAPADGINPDVIAALYGAGKFEIRTYQGARVVDTTHCEIPAVPPSTGGHSEGSDGGGSPQGAA